MRVLVVAPQVAAPTRVFQFLWRLSPSGGIPGVARTVLSGMSRHGFDLHVCTARPLLEEDRLDELGAGLTFHTLGLEGPASKRQRGTAALRLRSLIQRCQPDVVHTHSGVGWYALPWAAAPNRHAAAVLEVHDSPQAARVSALSSRVEGYMVRHLGVEVLVHSRSVARDLAATGIAPDRCRLIPIGIETSRFRAADRGAAWRRRRGIADGELVVTYVARLVASKNPALFVQIAAEVAACRPRARFVLVGEGPLAGALVTEAGRLGLDDRLLVVGYEPDLAAVLAATDLFLSTSEYEGFGIAILEAMATGVPVVTTAVGGTEELVVPEVTGVISPADSANLVLATLRLLDDPAARRRMGAAGRARASELFEAATMVASYEDMYRSLARRRR